MIEIKANLEVISSLNSLVGEGPLWDADKKLLYFVDIRGKKLHIYDWRTAKLESIELPQQTGCIALQEDGALLFGMEDGIYVRDSKREFIPVNQKTTLSGTRFNDGKPGPDGRYYAGTILREGGAKLYRLDSDNKLVSILDNVRISNGLDWSMDEKTFYYCDTPTLKIDAFDFDSQVGTITNRRTVIEIPPEIGSPDGLTVDSEGMLWIALWNGGRVVRANPQTGELLAEIKLPASRVSCPVFAGEQMNELVVTTAAFDIDLTKEQKAGNVFRIKLDITGRKCYRVRKNI